MTQKKLQKYFSKRRSSIAEVICVILLIACIPLAIVVPGGIPLSMPVACVCAVVLVFAQAAKVKDSEVDALLSQMIASRKIPLDPRCTLQTYDLAVAPAVKGKDGKLRTGRYIISIYEPIREGDETRRIIVYRLHLLDGQIDRELYDIPVDAPLSLAEGPVMTTVGRRTRSALTSPAIPVEIPVTVDDIDSAQLVERLCGG